MGRVLTRAEWNELIQEVNAIITDPPDGCEPLEPLEEVDPKHRWKKSDIREIQEALSETCPEIEWEEIPAKWQESILDEIREKFAEAWCECEGCTFATSPWGEIHSWSNYGYYQDNDIEMVCNWNYWGLFDTSSWGDDIEIPIEPSSIYTDPETNLRYWDWVADFPQVFFCQRGEIATFEDSLPCSGRECYGWFKWVGVLESLVKVDPEGETVIAASEAIDTWDDDPGFFSICDLRDNAGDTSGTNGLLLSEDDDEEFFYRATIHPSGGVDFSAVGFGEDDQPPDPPSGESAMNIIGVGNTPPISPDEFGEYFFWWLDEDRRPEGCSSC